MQAQTQTALSLSGCNNISVNTVDGAMMAKCLQAKQATSAMSSKISLCLRFFLLLWSVTVMPRFSAANLFNLASRAFLISKRYDDRAPSLTAFVELSFVWTQLLLRPLRRLRKPKPVQRLRPLHSPRLRPTPRTSNPSPPQPCNPCLSWCPSSSSHNRQSAHS